MTPYILLPLVGLATVCLLLCVLSAVYIWSGNAARRTRAWRVLRALLHAVARDGADNA